MATIFLICIRRLTEERNILGKSKRAHLGGDEENLLGAALLKKGRERVGGCNRSNDVDFEFLLEQLEVGPAKNKCGRIRMLATIGFLGHTLRQI
jgi:hypothetical protein